MCLQSSIECFENPPLIKNLPSLYLTAWFLILYSYSKTRKPILPSIKKEITLSTYFGLNNTSVFKLIIELTSKPFSF